jgi:hypothetical protein
MLTLEEGPHKQQISPTCLVRVELGTAVLAE